MPDQLPFTGFEAPTENYYRLPNNWFDVVIRLLRQEFGNRIVGLIKTLEYILFQTWGYQNWNGQVRLSANEIRNGRRGSKKDPGTGLSENTVNSAGKVLQKLGLINIDQDKKDKARRLKTYSPNILETTSPETAGNFEGFVPPISSYFIVPKIWIALMREISSAATIIIVEYSFRHAWGYGNPFGVWMTADEYVDGRKYRTSDRRYDNGTGYDKATIYRALNDAVKRGLLVYAEIYEDGYTHRVYNLRWVNMQVDPETGQCIAPLPWDDNDESTQDRRTSEAANHTVEVEDARTVEAVSRTNEAANCDVEAANRINEARSLKDTNDLNTKYKKPKSSTSTRKRKSRKSSNTKPVGDDVVVLCDLPTAVLEGLKEIDWADTTTEIQSAYSNSPELVTAWLDFACLKRGVRNRAGLFRKGLRTQQPPPYQIQRYLRPDPASEDMPEESDSIDEPMDFECTAINPDLDPNIIKVWQSVVSELERRMVPGPNFDHVKHTRVHDYLDGVMQIAVPNEDEQAWLESRIKSIAQRILIGYMAQEVNVEFVVPQGVS